MTFHEVAVQGRSLLMEAGLRSETATLDADLLARHALGWDLVTWLARRREPSTEDFQQAYDALIRKRIAREPVAYIRGVQEFWGRDFEVTPAVLIPRPETELLVELAGEYLNAHPRASVVDVGTGSGCIATTLALEHPHATVYATDISADAVTVARRNAARLGAHVHFVEGSMLDGVPQPVDLIVSNPPYVAERDKPGLSREVRDHEPDVALYGGNDGWWAIRTLLSLAPAALPAGGLLLMELGYGQCESIEAEVDAIAGLRLHGVSDDLQGIPRVARIHRTG